MAPILFAPPRQTTLVSSDKVPSPVSVHYGWADYAGDADLYNIEGFPAVPFRTDDWKELTRDAKFSFE